jgi:hypothetical protein
VGVNFIAVVTGNGGSLAFNLVLAVVLTTVAIVVRALVLVLCGSLFCFYAHELCTFLSSSVGLAHEEGGWRAGAW